MKLLLLAALALAACSAPAKSAIGPGEGAGGFSDPGASTGGSSGKSGGSNGGSPPPDSTSSDAGAAVSDGGVAETDGAPMPACATLIPISAPSFSDLPAAPGSKLRVRVRPADTTAAVTWVWTATYGDGVGSDVPVTARDPQATEVELPIEKPGRYQITASAAMQTTACSVTALAFATAADQRLGHFRVRIAPPPGPFPVQEVPVQAMAGVPVMQTVTVQKGQTVTFQPQDELGTRGIASYVRVNQLGTSLAVEGHTGQADFKPSLLAVFSYDVLFVPDDDIAPFVALGLTPAALNVLSQKLSPGGAVTGTLHDAAGAPLIDGRVILRAGALTSTVGKSTAAGDFALRVRAGQFAVTASPDPATGLPELSLSADAGITVADVASAGTVEVKWAPASPVAVSLLVRAADGVNAAAGARASLERTTSMAGAGSLVFTPPGGAPATHMMSGSVRLNGQAGTDGSVSFPRVPPGSYHLVVTPADTDRASALTAALLQVPASGVSGQPLRLSAKVKLRGTLLPTPASTGARVYATPREPDPPRPVASATVAVDGSYELDVDPQRSYVVWTDPAAGSTLARSQLAIVDAGAGDVLVPDRTVPRALSFKGTLVGEAAGSKIAGAVIQIFCDVAAASCLDPTITLGEGVSDRNGGFTLSLPDPGSF
jgi:hypothetical protein